MRRRARPLSRVGRSVALGACCVRELLGWRRSAWLWWPLGAAGGGSCQRGGMSLVAKMEMAPPRAR